MFAGTYTALVTPFLPDGAIDFECLKKLIELQVDAGVDGVVPCGTTGESPTVDFSEHQQIIDAVVEAVAGRCHVIAGTGGNSTKEAEVLTRHALQAGADATLQVTPYYNKPSQEGLYRHFSRIADIGLPVILYNIPGRTGREIAIETMARLAQHEKIIGVKEATGDVENVSRIVLETGLMVLSGDDTLTLPMMSVGGRGVISVASNVAPGPLTRLTHEALDDRWAEALELHKQYFQLFRLLLKLDTNPIPVKAALALMGRIQEVYRLPMCELGADKKAQLAATMRDLGLIA